MNVEKIIDIVCQGKNDEKVEDFLKFLSDKLWNQYKEHLMDNILVAENKVKSLAFSIPNAKEGKEYSQTVNVPDENMVLVEVSGISEEMHGLTITVADPLIYVNGIFRRGTPVFQNIFGEDIPDVGPLFLP